MANKPVHAAVERVRNGTPSTHRGPDMPELPIHARPRPLDGNMPAFGDTGIGHLFKVPPEDLEDRPMGLDLSPRLGPPPPIEVLVG